MKKQGIFHTVKRLLEGREDTPGNSAVRTDGLTMKVGKTPAVEKAVPGKLSAAKEQIAAQGQEIHGMFDHVIRPEERTVRNYLSAGFWMTKREEYRRVKEKEREDLGVFRVLSEGARPSIEYYLLTVLSCLIATAGLLQGSPAVIIGAMIVAPLMTPILAFSLGVIWGDVTLIRTALGSLLKGTLLAVGISAALSSLIPIAGYNPEILARTTPNLFDIIVAMASGLVGAYGNANKKISNTLVGIAIAVALMPPLCTVGIGVGRLDAAVASGAAILFLINLVSISLAGALVFWIMRIHPSLADRAQVKKRALYQIVLSVVILAAIAAPVGIYMREGYLLESSRRKAIALLEDSLGEAVLSADIKRISGRRILLITITGQEQPAPETIEGLRSTIRKQSPGIDSIQIRYIRSVLLER
ncbi:MAG: TIGR00341 family protein [Spirochaetes bacterium]|jgi:uncharacterized hydrophobic protein (TIGR00271 family)|nr:TIGR00341 family protein [Spirochaetota bacterium]